MRPLILITKIANRLKCRQLTYGILSKCSFLIRTQVFKDFDFRKAIDTCHSLYRDEGNSCVVVDKKKSSVSPQYELEVIIPVYNVEQYLEECVDSVLMQQTNFKFHVTIINDGSSDNSRNILSKYEKDYRVSIYDEENKGFSGARNTGLHYAQGRYIMFVDSDDRLPQGAIQVLMTKAIEGNYDIVEGGHHRFDSKGIISKHLPDVCKFSGFPWGKVYRAEIWKGVQFPEKYWFEDTIFSFIINDRAKRKTTVQCIVYDWRKNFQSISFTSVGRPKIIDTIYVTLKMIEDRKSLELPMDINFLSTLILQLKINTRRIYSLHNKKMDYANFVISRYIYNQYAKDCMKSQNEVEIALFQNDFKRFMLACWLL